MQEFFEIVDEEQKLPVGLIKELEGAFRYGAPDLFNRELVDNHYKKLLILGAQAFALAEFCERKDWERKEWDKESLLICSARIFQKAAEIQERRKIIIDDNWILLKLRTDAALGFFASLRLSISTPLSRKILKSITEDVLNHYPLAHIYRCILVLAGNNLIEAENATAIAIEHYKKQLSSAYIKNLTENDLILFPILINVCTCLNKYSFHIRNDQYSLAHQEAIKIRQKSNLIAKIGKSELSFFLDRVGYTCQSLTENSYSRLREVLPYETVDQKKKVDAFIKYHLEQGYYFLFNSQRQAIFAKKILNNSRYQVISMPTGSGKTFLATLFIFKSLLIRSNTDEKVILIVPTRALAREKLQELGSVLSDVQEVGFSLCQITGEYMVDIEENIKANDLLIMTQEKFDLLIREAFCGSAIIAVVSDEFHNIFKSPRGLKLQISIDRFRKLPAYAESSLYFISAILSPYNINLVTQWLYANEIEDSVYKSGWRPMFTRRGIATFQDFSRSKNKSKTWVIEYNDGQMAFYDSELVKKGGRKDTFQNTAVRELAIKLASEDQLYFFSPGKGNVLKYAGLLKSELSNTAFPYISLDKISERQEYAKKIRRLIGECAVLEAFEAGIATHHSDFPIALRRIMEKAIKDKVVGILVATNTLADGLNMPVRTILIPKPELGGDDMEIGLFLNLAGRAGRPFISEEGQVILAEGKENIDFEKYYLANENNIESSKGPIAEFLELDQKIAASDNLNKKKRLELEKKTYKAYFESLMLALIAEGIYTKLANDQQLIASLLFNTSETTLKERLNILLIETEEKFYKEYKVTEIMNSSGDYRVTARGLAIYKSGFSPYSGLDTISWLEKNKAVVNYFSNQKVDIYDPNFYQNWKVLIEKLIQTEECKLFLNLESYDSALSASQAVWVTLNWMKGDDIRKISGQFFEPKHGNLARFTCLSFLEGKLCPSLSWGLYGLSQWIKVVLGPNSEQIEENFKKLAKMIWFGCSTHLSLTLCGLDESRILNRNDILELTSRISRKQIPNFISNPILLESGDFLQMLNVNSEAWLTEPSELLSDLIKIFRKK